MLSPSYPTVTRTKNNEQLNLTSITQSLILKLLVPRNTSATLPPRLFALCSLP